MLKRRHIGVCVLLYQTTYSHQKENVLWKDLFSLKEISFIGGKNCVWQPTTFDCCNGSDGSNLFFFLAGKWKYPAKIKGYQLG